ncbi:MAG: hypothetical protein FWG40_12325 [Peptococcaceae bacterium]|nr:hypothetical protein [Peptococcaceae bacterium]
MTEEDKAKYEENGWNFDLAPKGILTFVRDDPEGDRWGWCYQSWETLIIGASLKPASHSVSIERTTPYKRHEHFTYVTGSGSDYEDEPLASKKGSFVRGAVTHMKMIDGWLYACTGRRGLGKRLSKGKWKSFSECFPVPEEGDYDKGFEDFDAFNESDIYLAGGKGDIWHFDGKKARQIPIPTNANLETVCCGGDGEVYVSGSKGMTFHGRGDRWEKVENEEPYEDPTTLPFRDMVWYEDKVWATNDFGLWVIENNIIKKADVPEWVFDCSGDLSVGDGVLLLSGRAGAVFRENGEWHKILLFDEMEALLEAEENG